MTQAKSRVQWVTPLCFFKFVAFVYGVTSFLFVAYGEMSFRMVFNLAFGVYTVGLFSSTLVKIRRSNPKFQNTLIGFCIALMVVCGTVVFICSRIA